MIIPMKRLFLLLAVCGSLLSYAGSYNYLVFVSTAGTTTTFSVEGLTMHVEGSHLHVSNTSGTVDLVLTDLASMQFSSDGTTMLEYVLNADATVLVYSVSGVQLASYGSLIEAAQELHAGVYVISNGKVAQTVVINN